MTQGYDGKTYEELIQQNGGALVAFNQLLKAGPDEPPYQGEDRPYMRCVRYVHTLEELKKLKLEAEEPITAQEAIDRAKREADQWEKDTQGK